MKRTRPRPVAPLPRPPQTAGIYIRVSKGDGSQTTENQRPPLEEFVAGRGWRLYRVYEDQESAQSGDRQAFQSMLADAEAHKFDVIVFWSLDRFSREGSFATLEYLNRLSRWGVGYVSLQEQYLDTVGPFKDAVVAILACIAQQERLRISERVKAGLLRAAANGKRIGKPPKVKNLDYFRRASAVYNVEELMTLFHCGRATIYNLRRQLRQTDQTAA